MQVRDEQAWQEQLTEFEADELSRKFRDFLIFWAETVEKTMSEASDGIDRVFTKKSTLRHHFSKGLEVAEQTFGWLSVEWIGQMMLVFTQHWVHGELLFESLSVIEKRLVQQATAMKLAELQAAATMPTAE